MNIVLNYVPNDIAFSNLLKLPLSIDLNAFNIFCYGFINGTLLLHQSYDKIVLWNSITQEFKLIPPMLF